MNEAERWRDVMAEVDAVHGYAPPAVVRAGDALATALEARDRRIADLEAGLPRPTLAWLRGVMETIADHGHKLQVPTEVGSRARGHASAVVAWLDLLAGRAAE